MSTVEVAQQEWDSTAAAWDEHVEYVDAHSAELTATLFERVAPQLGDRVLEVGAGPGSLGGDWSRLVGPNGTVLLGDIAPAMVEAAARRNREFANVTVAVLDASATERPEHSFDVIASRMAMMFAPDPAIAFDELHRVLAPGGRLGVATWAGMEHNPWMTCVGMAAMVNGLLAGGPPIGPGGIFSLGDADELERLATRAGFVDAAVEVVDMVFRSNDIDTHVRRVGSLAGPLAAVLDGASPEQRSALHRTATELAAPYITDTGVQIPARALLLSAQRH